MGQQESTPQQSEVDSQVDTNNLSNNEVITYDPEMYEFEKQVNDPRFGEIKIMVHKNFVDRKFAVKQKYCTSKEEFNETVAQIQFLKYISHPNIVKVYEIRAEKDEGFCSQVFLIRTIYEFVSLDLNKLTIARTQDIENIQFFDESEIVQILQDIVAGLLYLKESNIYHGDITSENILITQDEQGNTMGRLHIPYYTNQSNHYVSLLRKETDQIYLSPQLFQQLGQNELKPTFDQEKSDLFSVGIIGLQICLLEETNSCYNQDDFTIRHDTVQAKLQQIADKYSESLAETLISFLETAEENRATFAEAQELLLQHSEAKDIQAQIDKDYQQQSEQTKKLVEESRHLHSSQKHHGQEEEQQIHGGNFINNNIDHHYDENGSQIQNPHEEEEQEHEQEDNQGEYQDHIDVPHNDNLVSEKKKRAGGFNNHQPSNQSPQSNDYGNQSGYGQSTGKKEFPSIRNDQLNHSLKNIDDMVKEAMGRSEDTRLRYENNQQLKSFMKDLLDDEIFVPLSSSPSKKSNQKGSRSNLKSINRSFKPDERWKI